MTKKSNKKEKVKNKSGQSKIFKVKSKTNITKAKSRRVEKNYSDDILIQAMNAVGQGQSIREAAKKFNVPKSTLHLKLNHATPLNVRKGAPTILTQAEEMEIVNWIIACAEMGFPVTKEQLLDHVQKFIIEDKRSTPFKDNRPGKFWYSSFMSRHPNLSLRTSQNLTTSRASLDESSIRDWFSKIQSYLEKKNLINLDPKFIFNLDESAFQLVPKDNVVIAKKGAKSVYQVVSKNEKACITVLFVASAAGVLPPPMILFDLKNTPKKEVLQKIPKAWGVGSTDGGWMTADSFHSYMVNVFYKWLVENNLNGPVIVYADNHSSHVSLPLLKFCQEKNIELVGLYPNATHVLQPLDVSFFHPLKDNYKKVLRTWRIDNNVVDFKKSSFATVLDLAIKNTDYSETIKNGFKACGLYPFNPNAVNYDFLNKKRKKRESDTPQVFTEDSSLNTSIASSSSANSNLLSLFETQILNPSTLNTFKSVESDDFWSGEATQQELFIAWKKMKKLAQSEKSEVGRESLNISEESIATSQGNTSDNNKPKIINISEVPIELQYMYNNLLLAKNNVAKESLYIDTVVSPIDTKVQTHSIDEIENNFINYQSNCDTEEIVDFEDLNLSTDLSISANEAEIINENGQLQVVPIINFSLHETPEATVDSNVHDNPEAILNLNVHENSKPFKENDSQFMKFDISKSQNINFSNNKAVDSISSMENEGETLNEDCIDTLHEPLNLTQYVSIKEKVKVDALKDVFTLPQINISQKKKVKISKPVAVVDDLIEFYEKKEEEKKIKEQKILENKLEKLKNKKVREKELSLNKTFQENKKKK